MAGVGIYKWNDGRVYKGGYQADQKEGYGIYKWPDGRTYQGYWADGKQHGLGIYIVQSENKTKYGLWENGKRIKWFTDAEVQLINEHNYDYPQLFKELSSVSSIDAEATFELPKDFNKRLMKLDSDVTVLRANI